MSQWIGCAVSIKCLKGTYQGEITSATNSHIVLTKAFCDGIPCDGSNVTVLATDISDLKLIDKQPTPPIGQSVVTIAKPVPKRAGRSQSLSESTSNKQNGSAGQNNNSRSSRPTGDVLADQHRNSTPSRRDKAGKQKWSKGWKDEACFGSSLDHTYNKDFDFEKNLALFDKRAVFDEINSHKPDLVKHADQRKPTKYRHDENVIATNPTLYRQITVPKQNICEYVTDDGLIIPSISKALEKRLWMVADRIGLSWDRRMELMGRATTEMAVQLLGGAHRLNPHNAHQCPTVIFLCGPNRQGAMGINAARQLASHGVNTVVYVVPSDMSFVKQELCLYKLTKNKIVSSISGLPNTADLIIMALLEDVDNLKIPSLVIEWVNNNKAPVLSIHPPATGVPGISAKFSLVPVLPLSHSLSNGKLYLCNLGFPIEIFNEVGIKYKSPFGSKFVIPLHLNNC